MAEKREKNCCVKVLKSQEQSTMNLGSVLVARCGEHMRKKIK